MKNAAAITAQLVDIIQEWSMPIPFCGCWIWCKATTKGYGVMNIGGATQKAHRVSWTVFRGPIPCGLSVLHKCDIPSCVNPNHLFLGTQADNMADMIGKGRDRKAPFENHPSRKYPELRRGESHSRARLSNDDILAIRASLLGCRRLARQYGVSVTHIANIRSRKAWAHI